MRTVKYSHYPRLRRAFKNALEISEIINRSEVYVWQRFSHPENCNFTYTEKRMILNALGEDFNSENLEAYFGRSQTHVV